MRVEAQAFKEAKERGDKDGAKRIAVQFVQSNRESIEQQLLAAVRSYREAKLDMPPTKEELVDMVSLYRQQGEEEAHTILSMWLRAEYAPVHIKGTLDLSKLRKIGDVGV